MKNGLLGFWLIVRATFGACAVLWIHLVADAGAARFQCAGWSRQLPHRMARIVINVHKEAGQVDVVYPEGRGTYSIPRDLSPVRVYPTWHHNRGSNRFSRGLPGLSIESALLRYESRPGDTRPFQGELTFLHENGDTVFYTCRR